MSSALQGGFLTTRPPGEIPIFLLPFDFSPDFLLREIIIGLENLICIHTNHQNSFQPENPNLGDTVQAPPVGSREEGWPRRDVCTWPTSCVCPQSWSCSWSGGRARSAPCSDQATVNSFGKEHAVIILNHNFKNRLPLWVDHVQALQCVLG